MPNKMGCIRSLMAQSSTAISHEKGREDKAQLVIPTVV